MVQYFLVQQQVVLKSMSFYYAYVLKSNKDNKLYVGSTQDLKSRVKHHNAGSVKSTRHRRPLKLVYYKAVQTKKRAGERERYLKTSWDKRFIKKQISKETNGTN